MIAILRHRARRARCGVDGQPDAGAGGFVPDLQPRHAQIAGDQQPRWFAEIELHVVHECQRTADEIDGHQPATCRRRASHRRRRQGDEAAGHRGQRLVWREHDGLAFIGDGDTERVLAHGKLEHRCEIVERDVFLFVDDRGGEAAAALLREDRQPGGLTEKGVGKGERGENDDQRDDRTAEHRGIVRKFKGQRAKFKVSSKSQRARL